MEENIDVEAECKNCNHAISVHKPRCSAQYHEFNKERICRLRNDLNIMETLRNEGNYRDACTDIGTIVCAKRRCIIW